MPDDSVTPLADRVANGTQVAYWPLSASSSLAALHDIKTRAKPAPTRQPPQTVQKSAAEVACSQSLVPASHSVVRAIRFVAGGLVLDSALRALVMRRRAPSERYFHAVFVAQSGPALALDTCLLAHKLLPSTRDVRKTHHHSIIHVAHWYDVEPRQSQKNYLP